MMVWDEGTGQALWEGVEDASLEELTMDWLKDGLIVVWEVLLGPKVWEKVGLTMDCETPFIAESWWSEEESLCAGGSSM